MMRFFSQLPDKPWFNHFVFGLNLIFAAVLCWCVSGRSPRLHDILLVWCMMNCVWLKPLLFKLSVPLLLLWLVYAPVGVQYGYPSAAIIASALETNAAEIREFVDPMLLVAAFLLAAFFGITVYTAGKIQASRKQHRFFTVFSALLTLVFVVNIMPIKKTAINLEYSELLNIVPHSWKQYRLYTEQREKMRVLQNRSDDWQILSRQPQYQNYLLVIGESASRQYLSAYGYPVPTSPFLERAAGTKFTNAISPSGYTTVSVPRLLTIPNPTEVEYHNSIIDLANKAGFRTYWISNQDRLGIFDNEVSYISYKAHTQYFYAEHTPNDRRMDRKLLPQIRNALNDPAAADRPKLIIVHLMGSHPRFSKRLDPDLPKFRFNNRYLSDYLSSLRQTDIFLEEIHQTLRQQQQPFSMIYLSDHGLTAQRLQHAATQFTVRIPLFELPSDATVQETDGTPMSGFGLVWYLSDWLGIKTQNQADNRFIGDSRQTDIDRIRVFDNETKYYSDLPASDEPLLLPEGNQ